MVGSTRKCERKVEIEFESLRKLVWTMIQHLFLFENQILWYRRVQDYIYTSTAIGFTGIKAQKSTEVDGSCVHEYPLCQNWFSVESEMVNIGWLWKSADRSCWPTYSWLFILHLLSPMYFVLHSLLNGPAQSHISPYILGQMNEEISRIAKKMKINVPSFATFIEFSMV